MDSQYYYKKHSNTLGSDFTADIMPLNGNNHPEPHPSIRRL